TITDGTSNCTITLPAPPLCNLTSTTPGQKTLTATYSGDGNFNGSTGTADHLVVTAREPFMVTGPGAGIQGDAKWFDRQGNLFQTLTQQSRAGIRVAVGDVNGDGTPDMIVASAD